MVLEFERRKFLARAVASTRAGAASGRSGSRSTSLSRARARGCTEPRTLHREPRTRESPCGARARGCGGFAASAGSRPLQFDGVDKSVDLSNSIYFTLHRESTHSSSAPSSKVEPGPDLEIDDRTGSLALGQPALDLGERDQVHGDVLVLVATTVADPLDIVGEV